MAVLTLKTEIPVEFDSIVDSRTVVHEFALDGDEGLEVGDLVALVSDGVSLVAVLTEVDALPRAERQAAVPHRQQQRDAQQPRFDVGRHVVGALRGVHEIGRPVGDRAVDPAPEVGPHVGIGVFIQAERRGRVLQEEVEHSHPHAGEVG